MWAAWARAWAAARWAAGRWATRRRPRPPPRPPPPRSTRRRRPRTLRTHTPISTLIPTITTSSRPSRYYSYFMVLFLNFFYVATHEISKKLSKKLVFNIKLFTLLLNNLFNVVINSFINIYFIWFTNNFYSFIGATLYITTATLRPFNKKTSPQPRGSRPPSRKTII